MRLVIKWLKLYNAEIYDFESLVRIGTEGVPENRKIELKEFAKKLRLKS